MAELGLKPGPLRGLQARLPRKLHGLDEIIAQAKHSTDNNALNITAFLIFIPNESKHCGEPAGLSIDGQARLPGDPVRGGRTPEGSYLWKPQGPDCS